MKCPTCGSLEDRVIDSRTAGDGSAIRRRRVCQSCSRRFTTYERIEWNPPLVIKKDTSREPFSRDKVLSGLRKACEKRPAPADRLELAVDKVERMVQESGETEILAVRIGEMLVEELKQIDQVAYVRFASVYQEFADPSEFAKLLGTKESESRGVE
jgi:transcriptional repressor NrdR